MTDVPSDKGSAFDPPNTHSWIDRVLFEDNTHLPIDVQVADMIRDIRRAVTLILFLMFLILISI